MGAFDTAFGILIAGAAIVLILSIGSWQLENTYNDFENLAISEGFSVVHVARLDLDLNGTVINDLGDNQTLFLITARNANITTIYRDTTPANGLLFVAKTETEAWNLEP